MLAVSKGSSSFFFFDINLNGQSISALDWLALLRIAGKPPRPEDLGRSSFVATDFGVVMLASKSTRAASKRGLDLLISTFIDPGFENLLPSTGF